MRGYGVFQHSDWSAFQANPIANGQDPRLAGGRLVLPWSQVQPTAGTYNWAPLDAALAAWGGIFKTLQVDVMFSPAGSGSNPYSPCTTPQWVFDAGAAYFDTSQSGQAQRIPVCWDPIFLAKAKLFIHAMAVRYDGNPALEWITIGPGVFCSTRFIYPPNYTQGLAGYTDQRWWNACYQIARYFKNSFNKTRLVMGLASFISPNLPEDPSYNHGTLAADVLALGPQVIGLAYHDLRGNAAFSATGWPAILGSAGNHPVMLGMDNPTSGNPQKMWQEYGDPMSCAQYAMGGVGGMPALNTKYVSIYQPDITAGIPGSPNYQKPYSDALDYYQATLKP